MNHKIKICLQLGHWNWAVPFVLLLLFFIVAAIKPVKAESRVEKISNSFDKRLEQMLEVGREKSLKIAKVRPPLHSGRSEYSRHFSYSIVEYSARSLYFGENLAEVNRALVKNAQFYLDNHERIYDRDSFHWHAEMILRFIEMYGPEGSVSNGRLKKETVDVILEPIYLYTQRNSRLEYAEYSKSKTWDIYMSENHHVMTFTVLWHFSKIAKDHQRYKNMPYMDGKLANEHYQAWDKYIVEYIKERARRSMFIEMQNEGYNIDLLKGFYNFYDFGEQNIRNATKQFLDLYWAYWAQEQMYGVQGGGRSRIYFSSALKYNKNGGAGALACLYFDLNCSAKKITSVSLSGALSHYRPDKVIVDIATDIKGRGTYEVFQRPLGLAKEHPIIDFTPMGIKPITMRMDEGGNLRYSYVTPEFIIGTVMTEARAFSDWAQISSQNRWQGVVFPEEGDKTNKGARIVPLVRPSDNRTATNAQWSVQSKGTLITQKLEAHQVVEMHRGAAEMMVWISEEGLADPTVENGIVFTQSKNAFAAIRVVGSKFEIKNTVYQHGSVGGSGSKSPPGYSVVPLEHLSPVILEVGSAKQFESFEKFKDAVHKAELNIVNSEFGVPSILLYESIYGDTLTFDTSYRTVPKINGKYVNYSPEWSFSSPFLQGKWGEAVVTVKKGQRVLELDFESIPE